MQLSLSFAHSMHACPDVCGSTDLLCCSPSPLRAAIISMPKWTDLFAETLLLHPELKHELYDLTNRSLSEIDEQHTEILKDVRQQCLKHTCLYNVRLCAHFVHHIG